MVIQSYCVDYCHSFCYLLLQVGYTLANTFGARQAIKDLKMWPKRLIYSQHIEKVYSKYIPNIEDRNATYLVTPTGQPVWLYSNLAVAEEDDVGGDQEGYWQSKRYWQEYFTSGRKDPDNNNRPFSLEEVTHHLASNELEAYIFMSASIQGKDDFNT